MVISMIMTNMTTNGLSTFMMYPSSSTSSTSPHHDHSGSSTSSAAVAAGSTTHDDNKYQFVVMNDRHHHHHHHHEDIILSSPLIMTTSTSTPREQLSTSTISSTISTITTIATATMGTSMVKSEESWISLESILTMDTILTLILPYSIIFILSIVGNLLVIITLTLDRSMRSVTNIFLLNLAISDLLLGVFCMPFTLVGVLLRRFIFGAFMCHMISYFQAVSVAVSVWTLVAMSIERYYAICHPFRSRESRQTKKHAYRILALVWTLAFITMSPTAIVSELQLIVQTGHYKCREAWPSFVHKEAFTIFLDCVLLIIPLIVMVLTYSSIIITLRNNVQQHCPIVVNINNNKNNNNINTDNSHNNSNTNNEKRTTTVPTKSSSTASFMKQATSVTINRNCFLKQKRRSKHKNNDSGGVSTTVNKSLTSLKSQNNNNNYSQCQTNPLDVNEDENNRQIKSDSDCYSYSSSGYPTPQRRSSSPENTGNDNNSGGGKNGFTKQPQQQATTLVLRINTGHTGHGHGGHSTIHNRQRRIITMLLLVVFEFFLCWSPIFILDTMALYRPAMVYGTSKKVSKWIGIDIISVCHLLCFCSSCTNPITYCFMNQRFRDHFFSLFRCRSMSGASGTIRSTAGISGVGRDAVSVNIPANNHSHNFNSTMINS